MQKSVCMAAYNGSKYIKTQLLSILVQLEENDEVIIVDDASKDKTVQIINELSDPRIILIQNQHNLGVIKTFEKALAKASHEIIFLADQDDRWGSNKVKTITQLFKQKQDITLILSDAQVIDKNGEIIENSFFKIRGEFITGAIPNIIKNKYLGCTIAFRRKMLQYFLPFPQGIPMHDMWIGILNDIYGKTLYIKEPMIQYRRHDNNISPDHHANIQQILKWRYALIKNLIKRIFKIFKNFGKYGFTKC